MAKERSNSSSKPLHEDHREAKTSLTAMEATVETTMAAMGHIVRKSSVHKAKEIWQRWASLGALIQQKHTVTFRFAKMGGTNAS